jgi:hypothetical protein
MCKECIRPALSKCCGKPSEGLIECKECAKDKVSSSYNLGRKSIEFSGGHQKVFGGQKMTANLKGSSREKSQKN